MYNVIPVFRATEDWKLWSQFSSEILFYSDKTKWVGPYTTIQPPRTADIYVSILLDGQEIGDSKSVTFVSVLGWNVPERARTRGM